MIYTGNKAAVALFVEDLLQTFGLDLHAIMITPQASSEDFCVAIATVTSSEGIVKELAMNYSLRRIDI